MLGLALWQPENGDWTVEWGPDTASPTRGTCTFGVATDVPLGGIGVKNLLPPAGQQSDLAYFEAGFNPADSSANENTNGNGYLHTLASPVSSTDTCSTYTPMSTNMGVTPTRWRVFSVYDMTGDGFPEIVQVNPENSRFFVYTSESSYSAYVLYTIGDVYGVLL